MKMQTEEMLTALVQLHNVLQEVELPLDVPGAGDQRTNRVEVIDQLEDYVIPRLMTIDAPLLTVVGGSTGAGKSTLVNSLVGTRVTEPGVLRPTTRSPVLVHHPDDAHWFGQDRILPDLERTDRPTGDPAAIQLVPAETVPAGLAILDAPDIDSVEERNRTLAAQLLAAADLWLFVTSAARYADQVPWGFLKQAADRSTAVAIVLDRTPPDAVDTVAAHLARMLASRGLKDSPLFVVTEGTVDADGLLPGDRRLRHPRLAAVAGRQHRRPRGGRQADARGRDPQRRPARAPRRRRPRRAGGRDQRAARRRREGVRRRGRGDPRGQRRRDAPARRGAGPLAGVRRDRRAAALPGVQGRPGPRPAGQRGQGQAGRRSSGSRSPSRAASRRCCSSTPRPPPSGPRPPGARSPHGRTLLEGAPQDLGRASREFRREAERAVREWQQGVLDMVRNEGADKRTTARFLAFGVNGLSVALMVVVFAHTAGITGAEAGIAGGSAVLGQKLLEAVFGDQAVRDAGRAGPRRPRPPGAGPAWTSSGALHHARRRPRDRPRRPRPGA